MSEFKEIELPPRDSWEIGLTEAEGIATSFVHKYQEVKTVLAVENRDGGIPTMEEVKLSLALLVARRMVIEAQADLLHNSIAVERAKRFLMSHPLLPKPQKLDIVSKLGIKEGCGIKLAQGWRVMEQGLRQWQNQKFWKHKQPWVEARKLFFAIQGLEEVPSGNQDKGKGEPQGGPEGSSDNGSGAGGQQACEGDAGRDGEAHGEGDQREGAGERPQPEGAGPSH